MVQDSMVELMAGSLKANPGNKDQMEELRKRLARVRRFRVMREYLKQSKRMAKAYGGIIVEKGKVIAKV